MTRAPSYPAQKWHCSRPRSLPPSWPYPVLKWLCRPKTTSGSIDDEVRRGSATDDVIEAFPTDRADRSLRMPILPGRAWGRWMISDAHGRKPPGDSVAVGRVAVEIVRRLVPGE